MHLPKETVIAFGFPSQYQSCGVNSINTGSLSKGDHCIMYVIDCLLCQDLYLKGKSNDYIVGNNAPALLDHEVTMLLR